jgi:hypothetical protein
MSVEPSKFNQTAKSWGVAFLTSAFMIANANAADPAKFVQVADLDLNKPIPSNVCVQDDAQGTAVSKMRTIMGAREQKSVVAANQVIQNVDPANGGLVEEMVTSNLKQGSEGYMVSSNRPLGKPGTVYCFAQNQKVFIYSAFNSAGVPSIVNKGELGIALTNNHKAGLKVAIAALTEQGTIKVVNFDPSTGRGSIKGADGNGNKAGNMAFLVNAGYSASLPSAAKKALGIPDESVAQADGNQVALAIVAPSPSR